MMKCTPIKNMQIKRCPRKIKLFILKLVLQKKDLSNSEKWEGHFMIKYFHPTTIH